MLGVTVSKTSIVNTASWNQQSSLAGFFPDLLEDLDRLSLLASLGRHTGLTSKSNVV